MALFRWDSVGFSAIFFVKFYLPHKTLWWKWFVNPDPHSNIVQNAVLCFKRFFPWILLNFRKIFLFKRCSEKFSFENSEICIQNRVSTRLKSRSNEFIFWNSFWACAVERQYWRKQKIHFSPCSSRIPENFFRRILSPAQDASIEIVYESGFRH